MASELTIRVPWVPPAGMGMNAHKHWRSKHGPEQEAKQAGYLAAKSAIARKPWECPDMPMVIVTIHWERKSRRKDWDNAASVCKQIQDGICEALGIDDRRFITGIPLQKIDPAKQGYVEYRILPAPAFIRRLAS